jgi:hypothetical protein
MPGPVGVAVVADAGAFVAGASTVELAAAAVVVGFCVGSVAAAAAAVVPGSGDILVFFCLMEGRFVGVM